MPTEANAASLRGIIERPVMAVQLAGKNRAGLVSVAADGDDSGDRLFQKFLQVLRAVTGNVYADLRHDFHGKRMDIAGGI